MITLFLLPFIILKNILNISIYYTIVILLTLAVVLSCNHLILKDGLTNRQRQFFNFKMTTSTTWSTIPSKKDTASSRFCSDFGCNRGLCWRSCSINVPGKKCGATHHQSSERKEFNFYSKFFDLKQEHKIRKCVEYTI